MVVCCGCVLCCLLCYWCLWCLLCCLLSVVGFWWLVVGGWWLLVGDSGERKHAGVFLPWLFFETSSLHHLMCARLLVFTQADDATPRVVRQKRKPARSTPPNSRILSEFDRTARPSDTLKKGFARGCLANKKNQHLTAKKVFTMIKKAK